MDAYFDSDFVDDPLYNLEDNTYEDDLQNCILEELTLQSDFLETDNPLYNLEDNIYEDDLQDCIIEELTLQKDSLEVDSPEKDRTFKKNRVRFSDNKANCNESVSASSISDANHSSQKAGDERDTNVPLSETSNDEKPVSTSARPVYVWTDDKIDDGEFEGFPLLSVDQTIRLGEVMVIMVCQGPLYRVEEIVTALALNLRNPDDPSVHVFTEAERGDPPVAGAAMHDIAFPAVIQELEKVWEVEKYRNKKGNRNVKGRRTTSTVYVCRDALKEFLDWTLGFNPEKRAAMFSFLAASLVKSGVKNRDAMGKLWSKSISKLSLFLCFYHGLVPLLSRRAYQILNEGFRPESKLLKTVLRMFLKKNFAPDVSYNVKGVLCFTLLTHTSFNGMKMVTLTHDALDTLGDTKIKALQKLDSLENRSSINTLLEYYNWYCEDCPLDGSKYVSWCRMFDRKYWSNLSPKDHTSLATLLLCIMESSNKKIWKMKSVKPTEECKTKCREIAKELRKDALRDFEFLFERLGLEIK